MKIKLDLRKGKPVLSFYDNDRTNKAPVARRIMGVNPKDMAREDFAEWVVEGAGEAIRKAGTAEQYQRYTLKYGVKHES